MYCSEGLYCRVELHYGLKLKHDNEMCPVEANVHSNADL